MKLAYVYPPLFKPFFPMATRILTENLLRNPRLEPDFSRIPAATIGSRAPEELYDRIMARGRRVFHPNAVAFLEQKYIVNSLFYVFMAHGVLDPHLGFDFDAEYVLATCINFCDLIIVQRLLGSRKRVVLGGPLVNIGLSSELIRGLLGLMGTEPRALADRLIIVRGNVDPGTDLYGLIRDWKDATIQENDFSGVFECRRDFLQSLYGERPGKIPIHLGFRNRCWYGKCRFCTYAHLPEADFLKGVEDEDAARGIRELMRAFGSEQIRFIDSYFHAGLRRVRRILSLLGESHITLYTGILLLKNRDYLQFLNEHAHVLLIGLESASDYSLGRVNKGYEYKDVLEAVERIIAHLDRRLFLEISIIVDLPARNAADVRENYRRIAGIQDRLLEAGFRVGVHMNILSPFPNMDLLRPEEGLYRTPGDPGEWDLSCGKNFLVHLLRRGGMEQASLLPAHDLLPDPHALCRSPYGYLGSGVPVVRLDEEGKVLPSDLLLAEEDVMARILRARRKRSPGEAPTGVQSC